MIIDADAVVLIGKLGHGKTRIVNKICGTHYPSTMDTSSCTTTLQCGITKNNKIFVIDTPGLCARDDPAAHLAGVTIALENIPLSGVYVVIKWGRADDIAETLDPILDFLGDDDIRLIITHADTACQEPEYDEGKTKRNLSEQFNIPVGNIAVIGRNTSSVAIENFFKRTLHNPKRFEISDQQIAAISSRTAGLRKTNKPINAAIGKIEAATQTCYEIISKGQHKTNETDFAILTIQDATNKMIIEAKEEIFRSAEDLNTDEQNLVYGKAGIALSLKLKNFMETTNKYLTWDVADVSDPRNQYRKCPHCGAVWIKVEGCDGETSCGAVPSMRKLTNNPRLQVKFCQENSSTFSLEFIISDIKVAVKDLRDRINGLLQWTTFNSGTTNIKKSDAKIESGCGRRIVWSTMIPVEPDKIQSLGNVELYKPEEKEKASQNLFKKNLRKHGERNRKILEQSYP